MQLLQQFMTQELQTSSQPTAMNPYYSVMDCFNANVYTSTSLYSNYSTITNAFLEDVCSVQAGSTGYLNGLINPARLRMSCHFEGSASGVYGGVGDNPAWNSNNGATGKITYNGTSTGTPVSVLASGLASATSFQPNQPASGAFDGNNTTYWANYAPIVPGASGVPFASGVLGGQPASNAFDNSTATYWDSSAMTNSNVFASIVNPGFSSNNTGVATLDLGSGNSFNIGIAYWNFRPGYANNSGVTYTIVTYGSNDASNYTQIDSWSGTVPGAGGAGINLTRTLNVGTNYRYFKWTISPLSSGIYNQGGNSNDAISSMVFYTDMTQFPQYIGYDMGSGNSCTANYYTFASSVSGYQPTSWILQGSNNNVTWTSLDTQTSYAGSYPFAGTFANSTAYRYYQLLISASNATFNNEVRVYEFRVAPSSAGYLSTNPQALEYDLGSGRALALNSYTINSPNSSYYPVGWTFQGSNDNSSWTPLNVIANYAGSFPVTETFFNNTPYRYYQLVVQAAKGNNDNVFIGELTSNAFATSYLDASVVQFGTTSLKLRDVFKAYATQGSNTAYAQIGTLDFLYSAFYTFDPVTYANQGLFYLSNSFDIIKVQNGIQVNYYTGSTWVNLPVFNFSWSFNTTYCIQVGRVSGILSVAVNGSVIGTYNLTGVSFPAISATNGVYLGYSHNLDYMYGNVDEVQLYIGDNGPGYVVPSAAASGAYLPAMNLQSSNNYISSTPYEVDVMVFQDVNKFTSYGGGVAQCGTDWLLNISLNGGVNFTNVPLSKGGNFTPNCIIYRGYLNLTGITNTNQLCYQIVNNAGKVIKIDGVIIYWQDVNSTIFSMPIAELGSFPTPTDSLANKIQAIYQYLTFKRTNTTTTESIYTSTGSVLSTATLTDDGTTFTKGAQ